MATHKPTKKRGLTLYDQEADQSSQIYTKVMPTLYAWALAYCYLRFVYEIGRFLILTTIANAILVHILFLTANIVLFMRKLIRLCY